MPVIRPHIIFMILLKSLHIMWFVITYDAYYSWDLPSIVINIILLVLAQIVRVIC